MAGKYRRGNTWSISWVDPETGKQQRRSLGAVTEAEAEAARRAKEQSLGQVAAAGPTFTAWAERYAQWHSSEYPDSYYRVEQILRQHLVPAFGPLPLLAITRETGERYKRDRLAQANKVGTVVKEWRTLQACLNYAVACEVIPRNPLAHVRAPRDLSSRPPRWYTKDELARIYAAELSIHPCTTAEDAALHQRYRWTWQLMANSGIRRGEALHLQWPHIGAEEIGILSEEGARTKSGRWRSIPISQGAREALEALRGPGRSARGYVVPQLAPASMTRCFHRTLRRADIDGTLHSLRHTYCAHLVQAGVPLRTVQVLAGHASYATTERYAHLAPSHLRASIAGLNL